LYQTYDYDNQKMIFFDEPKKDTIVKIEKMRLANISDTNKVALDKMPILIGGNDNLIRILCAYLEYPDKAREKGVQGKVILECMIDKQGNCTNFNIPNKIGNGFDEAVMYIVPYLKLKWIPAILNGSPVSVIYEMPVEFQLSE
jgi:TonB family protein